MEVKKGHLIFGGHHQPAVSVAQPGYDVGTEPRGKRAHRFGIGIGHQAGAFVPRDVPLLPERFERSHDRGLGSDGLPERLDHAVVVSVARCPVAGRCQRGGRRLHRRVVRDVHLPVRADARDGAVSQVTIDDREQVADLVRACGVTDQPAVSLPVGQAHRLPQ